MLSQWDMTYYRLDIKGGIMEKHPIKVLQVNADNFGAGGISVIIWRLMEKLKDRNVQMSFLTQRKYIEDKYLKEIKNQGGTLQHIKISLNLLRRYFDRYIQCYKILKDNDYDIIHINGNEAFGIASYVLAANRHHVCKIVVHAHSTRFMNGNYILIKKVLNKIFQMVVIQKADCFLACSKEAARFMYGNRADRARIVKNGLIPQRYCYDEAARIRIRDKNRVGNKMIIGHIGRFVYAKNHEFIIDVFEYVQKNYSNSELWLIGENIGSGYDAIYNKVKDKELMSKVKFLGNTDQIKEYLSAMDVLLFPSRFEGLPLVLVEAQVNGLPVVCSNAITDEAIFSPNVIKLSLDDSLKIWSDSLVQLGSMERFGMPEQKIAESGFDISSIAEIVFEEYKKIVM